MRTCLECNGNCCYNNIGIRLRQSFAIDHNLRLVPEGNNVLEEDESKAKDILMDSSYYAEHIGAMGNTSKRQSSSY